MGKIEFNEQYIFNYYMGNIKEVIKAQSDLTSELECSSYALQRKVIELSKAIDDDNFSKAGKLLNEIEIISKSTPIIDKYLEMLENMTEKEEEKRRK